MSTVDKAVPPSILDLITETCELPTMPDVLVKLNEAIADPDSSADDVARVIEKDPPIATNILKIVNSAYYGLQVRVSSINLAVSILGFTTTKKLALKAAVFRSFGEASRGHEAFDAPSFWKHSILTGILARSLGKASNKLDGVHAEDLYIAGLLHDIGKIVLVQSLGPTYAAVLNESREGARSIAEIEIDKLGYTHAEVGSVLAIKWFLPEDLTVAIRYHERPTNDPFYPELSSLVALADRMAHCLEPGSKPLEFPDFGDALLDTAGLDAERLHAIADAALEEFAETEMPW